MTAPFHFCQFCRNRAAWLYQPSRWWVCSSCREAVEHRQWDVLAARWRRKFPQVHVPDLAAVIEANLSEAKVPGRLARCHLCRNRGSWLYPAGWRLCSACDKAAQLRRWDALAERWLRSYPQEWVPDVAAFIEAAIGKQRGEPQP